VGEHAQRVESIQAKLASGETESLAETAAELAAANEQLKSDLTSAKEQLVKHESPSVAAAPTTPRTDPVTFLLNAQPFEESLDRFLSRKRATDQGSLLILSVGLRNSAEETQPASEDAMREAARVLSRSLQGVDAITSRYAPHEFGVLLCNAPQAQARKRASDIRAAIERLQLAGNETNSSLVVSIGLAHAEPSDTTGAAVRDRARAACDTAVQAGGSCGYWHNGEACVPLEAEPARAAEPAVSAPARVAASPTPAPPPPPPASPTINGVPVIEEEGSFTEKRAHERRNCQATYQIAPYWGNKLPTEDMFFTAQFADISPGGCAILLPEPPQYKAFVVALEKPDGTIYLSANIVNIRKYNKPGPTGRTQYAIGCKFTGRVQLPAARRESAAPLASVR
jgi:diguanylate cyclase (GGDEF)-like protein